MFASRIRLFTVSANDNVGTATAWIPLDPMRASNPATWFAMVSGVHQWRVQSTPDDVLDASITPIAFNVNTDMQGASAAALAGPAGGVRLTLASVGQTVSGRASARLWVRQGI